MLQPKKPHTTFINQHQPASLTETWFLPVPSLLIVSQVENLIYQGQVTLWGVMSARRAETPVPPTLGTFKTLLHRFGWVLSSSSSTMPGLIPQDLYIPQNFSSVVHGYSILHSCCMFWNLQYLLSRSLSVCHACAIAKGCPDIIFIVSIVLNICAGNEQVDE